MNKYSEMPARFIPPKSSGRYNQVKHPPAWSLKDLADHLKMPQSTLASRIKTHPLPSPISMTLKGSGGRTKHPCNLYTKKSLMDWYLSWELKHAKQ